MGLGLAMMSIAAFIPSPILFGYIIGNINVSIIVIYWRFTINNLFKKFTDRSCIVWGKTCTSKSNCWLYNSEKLKYMLNYTASGNFYNYKINNSY